MSNDDPRELLEYDSGDGTPSWERRRRVMRWIALVALVGMLVPTVLGTYATARSTAAASCRIAVDYYADERVPSRVAFEFLSPDAMGWTCYAELSSGDLLVAVLGLIPGQPRLESRIDS